MHRNISASLPQWKGDSVPMVPATVRITEGLRNNLDRITEATNAPSIGAAIRLMTVTESQLVKDGIRKPADYIPTTDPRQYTLGFKLRESDRIALFELKYFYSAKSISDVVCHLLNQAVRIIDGKDGE